MRRFETQNFFAFTPYRTKHGLDLPLDDQYRYKDWHHQAQVVVGGHQCWRAGIGPHDRFTRAECQTVNPIILRLADHVPLDPNRRRSLQLDVNTDELFPQESRRTCFSFQKKRRTCFPFPPSPSAHLHKRVKRPNTQGRQAAAQAQRRPPIETPSRWAVGGVGSAETEPEFMILLFGQQTELLRSLSKFRNSHVNRRN